jgi:hypothetical protein
MDPKKLQEILEKNMKNLEISENKQSTIAVDALNASRSTVSVPAIRSKYGGPEASSDTSPSSAADAPKVAVSKVRSKNTGADDSSGPVNRAMIFNENENNIEGFEG